MPTYYLRLLVVITGAALLACLIIKVTIADAFLKATPALTLALSPNRSDALLHMKLVQFQAHGGALDQESYRAALRAARLEPLAAEPFLFAGVRAQESDDPNRAQILLEEAEHRNPRLRPARLYLLSHYVRSGRIPQATSEISVLVRLLPEAHDLLISQLAMLAENASTRPAVVRSLESPALLNSVLLHLVERDANPQVVLDLARAGRHLRSTGDSMAWQEALVQRLVASGDIERAYETWRLFTPTAASQRAAIYDASFEGLPGIPPFNWTLLENAAGTAHISSPGMLEAEYFGRQDIELATQLLMLSQGNHILGFRVEGDASGEGARLEWQISCIPSGAVLMAMPLRGITSAPRTMRSRFGVPSGCRAQWLKLRGLATEFPVSQIVRIRSLQLQSLARGG